MPFNSLLVQVASESASKEVKSMLGGVVSAIQTPLVYPPSGAVGDVTAVLT